MDKSKKNRAAAAQSVQHSGDNGRIVQLWRPEPGAGPPRAAGLCGVRADGPLV